MEAMMEIGAFCHGYLKTEAAKSGQIWHGCVEREKKLLKMDTCMSSSWLMETITALYGISYSCVSDLSPENSQKVRIANIQGTQYFQKKHMHFVTTFAFLEVLPFLSYILFILLLPCLELSQKGVNILEMTAKTRSSKLPHLPSRQTPVYSRS